MLNYDDIKVSTKTVIAISNVTIDIEGVYRSYPLLKETEAVSTPGIVVKTIYYGADRRGRRRERKKSRSGMRSM
jgi:rRNA processing protein Gar1